MDQIIVELELLFLKELVNLSNKYQKVIELIYYPPYHSKYNPVERLWARLEKMWNDVNYRRNIL